MTTGADHSLEGVQWPTTVACITVRRSSGARRSLPRVDNEPSYITGARCRRRPEARYARARSCR